MTAAARASAVLATIVALTTHIAPARADPCADAKALGKRSKVATNPNSADWIVLAEAFKACKELRNNAGISYNEESEYISVQIANSYRSAFEAIKSEVTPLIQNTAQRREERDAALTERDAALTELKTAQALIAELEARPPTSKPVREPWFQRLAFRVETGYSTGHLTRVGSQGRSSHSGGFLQLSLLPRFSFHDQRHGVLFGAYYSFWRAKDKTSDVKLADAGTHSFGAKLEFDLALLQKIDRWLTVHPSIEMGLDYVRFDFNAAVPPEYNLEPSYVDRAGFVFAGNLNLCVWDAVGCIGVRLKSVPGQFSVPTTQVTFGFDPLRLVAAIKSTKARSPASASLWPPTSRRTQTPSRPRDLAAAAGPALSRGVRP